MRKVLRFLGVVVVGLVLSGLILIYAGTYMMKGTVCRVSKDGAAVCVRDLDVLEKMALASAKDDDMWTSVQRLRHFVKIGEAEMLAPGTEVVVLDYSVRLNCKQVRVLGTNRVGWCMADQLDRPVR